MNFDLYHEPTDSNPWDEKHIGVHWSNCCSSWLGFIFEIA